MSWVKSNVSAKHEPLFNKPVSEAALLNIKDRLKQHNKSVTKFVTVWSQLKQQL